MKRSERPWTSTTALAAMILVIMGLVGFNLEAIAGDVPAEPQKVEIMDGLTIEDAVVGDGATVAKGDLVTVHYTGWVLEDGKKADKPFDSSVDRGQPVTFPVGVGRLIKGWDLGIPGMKVGGTRHLTIAPELGYGATGAAGGAIPPNATLYFEVQMLAIPQVEQHDDVAGTGAEALSGDTVKVNYTGWLYKDGAKQGDPFDSSIPRGEPFKFTLDAGMVIPGWDKGVAGMKVGGKRTLVIPPELGYGARGAGPKIPPNSTLLFEVELVEVAGK